MNAFEPEVTESAEFYVVSDEIRRWSKSFRRRIPALCHSPSIFLLSESTTLCVNLTVEANVEKVFLRSEQLSEVNLDPGDTLADMVVIAITNGPVCMCNRVP